VSITSQGKIRSPTSLEVRLGVTPSLDEVDGRSADPDELFDLHTQTDGSDGHQTSGEIISEAFGNGLYLFGVSDHANVGKESKKYSSSFYGLELDDSDGEAFSEVYVDRFDAIQEIIADYENVVSWQEADIDKLEEDLGIIREYGDEYSIEELRENVLNYEMVVMNAFEPDFNPRIEDCSNPDSVVEDYIDDLKDFVFEAEACGAGFDHVNQAVHDVFVDGEFRYVKKDHLFEDLTIEEKEEVLQVYRDKLIYAVEDLAPAMKDTGKEIGAGIMNEGLTVSIVHPAIIERNEELMEVFNESKKKEAVKETENFIYGHNDVPIDGNRIIEDENIEDLLDDTDIEGIYPETALKEYWKPVVKSLEDAENTIFEINGKHVERFHPSILWEMIEEYIPGSDQHRPGEQKFRSQKTKNLDLEAKTKTPIDLIIENLRNKKNSDS